MNLDIEIDESWPDSLDWEDLCQRATAALGRSTDEFANPRLTASLLFTSDAEVHALNREWRGKDKPTNVLSFPMLEAFELSRLAAEGPPVLLGDVALAQETCAREAAERGISLEHHAAHLIVHGLLHLAGHDHELSPLDAEAMEMHEIKALAQMGIGNPYDHDETD